MENVYRNIRARQEGKKSSAVWLGMKGGKEE